RGEAQVLDRRSSRFVVWLTLLAFLSAPCAGMAQTDDPSAAYNENANVRVSMVQADKLASDLSATLQAAQPNERVKVIVQFKGAPALQAEAVLADSPTANVVRRFARLNARVLTLPANAVAALAARADVAYVGPDRPAAAFGHVTTTTGTEAVRTQTSLDLLGLTTNTTLDGTGIGIAVLDSGIDATHVAFRNSLGLSRVVASQDFTGENRTDDPYGNGTHVASLAAGNGQVAGGAYIGIAPAANLINLRVLDAQGAGSTSNVLAALDWVLQN